jgi:thioredoxin reductase
MRALPVIAQKRSRKPARMRALWDVVIVGAGPAGLSAALVLGRCRRTVLICDRGTPRSWASKAMHGFITRDGIPPGEFRRMAHAELRRYSTVAFWRGEVQKAKRNAKGHFIIQMGRRTAHARKLLIATGLLDQLPAINGAAELFGTSVFQCPYCDGWEFRDQPLAAYGRRQRGFEMSRALTAWSRDVLLCTDGPSGLTRAQVDALERNGIRVVRRKVQGLESREGKLTAVRFKGGLSIPRKALFFDTPSWPQSPLAAELGCQFAPHGGVLCGKYEATSVPGVYVAGNIIRDVQLAIVAAAEGTRAAFGINRALTQEDFSRIASARRSGSSG